VNKVYKKIAVITLDILKKKSWHILSLSEVKNKSKIRSFDELIKSKQELLKILNNYFDYNLSLQAKSLENSNQKDMIFEILMIRFDILQSNRKGIISIFNSFKKKPQELIFLLPNLLDSIVLMFKFTKISSTGIIGQMKIKGIFIIYISSFLVWIKDDSPSLEKTMKSLDNYLDQAGKILKFIN